MINVAITEVKGMIHISCYGHTGKKGESLTCAGASTLFGALSVAVEDKTEYICESGYGYMVYPATGENKAYTHMFRKGMELLSVNFPGEFSI
jgi:uncharacterized protein YsxB (DUF464 family)